MHSVVEPLAAKHESSDPSCPFTYWGIGVFLVLCWFLISVASVALGDDFEAGFEKANREDLEAMIEDYVDAYHGMNGHLPWVHIDFTRLASQGKRLKLEVTTMVYFPEQMSRVRSWLTLPAGWNLVEGKSEWAGTMFAFGHHTFEAVALLPDSTGAQALKAYSIAVEAQGRIMSAYSTYWAKSAGDSILVARDPDMRDRLMVSMDRVADEPAPADTVSVYKTLPDSMPGMIFAFDTYPEVVYHQVPVYPEEAAKAKLQGVVRVMVTIDEFGDVIEQWVAESDHEALNQAALDAAKRFKFTPAMQRGHRVKATIMVPFHFSLSS